MGKGDDCGGLQGKTMAGKFMESGCAVPREGGIGLIRRQFDWSWGAFGAWAGLSSPLWVPSGLQKALVHPVLTPPLLCLPPCRHHALPLGPR